jgi:hypothetical protein
MEQNNYGGKNYQIKAERIDHVGDLIYQSVLPTGEDLLTTGLQLLSIRDYRNASDILSNAIKTDPSLSDAYYYLAIALLGGKKPRKIDRWTIQDIEEKLNAAISINSNIPKYYALLAIVKHGYYVTHKWKEEPPTSMQLFKKSDSIQTKQAKEILFHLKDEDLSNPYWMDLYSKFGRLN